MKARSATASQGNRTSSLHCWARAFRQPRLFRSRPWLHLPYLMHTKDQARFAAHWQTAAGGRWVLGPKDLLEKEFDLKLGTDLGRRHSEDWWLLPPGSARPAGPPTDDPIYRYVPAGAKP